MFSCCCHFMLFCLFDGYIALCKALLPCVGSLPYKKQEVPVLSTVFGCFDIHFTLFFWQLEMPYTLCSKRFNQIYYSTVLLINRC